MRFGAFKKIFCVGLAMGMTFLAFGCDRSGIEGEQLEEGKTPLYVGVYDGAVGYEMVTQIANAYEKDNPDVDVIIRHKRSEYDDASLVSKIRYGDEDLYFGSTNWLETLAKNNLILDLTDTVTEKIYDNAGELTSENATKSIQDILWDDWEYFCQVDTGNGNRFYGVPNYGPVAGISYDADLFEEYGYEVPETYDQLKLLMDRMLVDKITPFTVAQYNYIMESAIAFYANYEGKANFRLNTTFNGTDSNLGEITEQTAWKLQAQEGRRAYYQFYYDLASNPQYTTLASRGSQTHKGSQDSFVSSIASTKDFGRVAMIVENSFWEREAKGTIDSLGEGNANWGWGKRNFKYMIAPVNKETDRKTVYMSYPNSYCFVNAYTDQKDLALDFLQYSLSRTSLATYTIHCGCLRPYDYTMTDTEYDQATPYTQSLIDLMRREDVDFVTLGAGNKVAKYWGNDYESIWSSASKSADGNDVYRSPYSAFIAKENLTTAEYFSGCSLYMSESEYMKIYNKVYGG